MDVGRWFEERTYHHKDFGNIPKLIDLKRKQGLKVSVCLPTLNSSATVGLILRIFKEILVEEYPLIDELAIVDSRSTDDTVEIAEHWGVPVFYDDEYLKDLTPGTGKGEALWKSLYFLKGDIVCWVDSDIENVHPRFVYGPVGALLAHEDVGYVKGFYSRPLKKGDVVREGGGGRVTEILARPFLNLFYPDLAGFIQPLSGEYAGRREVLESVPFFTGYGVETGLLIDILAGFGLMSMAQVNLDKRVHTNQSTKALGRMSFGIMQAAFMRLDHDRKIELLAETHPTMKLIKRKGDDYFLEDFGVEVVERPPMNSIKEYAKQQKGGR